MCGNIHMHEVLPWCTFDQVYGRGGRAICMNIYKKLSSDLRKDERYHNLSYEKIMP